MLRPKGDDVNSLDAEALVRMCAPLLDHDIFVTKNNHLGNGPKDIQAGSEVWILNGGKMPLILRPLKESRAIPELNLEAVPCHTLVGDCYVNDIRDGEAADAPETNPVDIFII